MNVKTNKRDLEKLKNDYFWGGFSMAMAIFAVLLFLQYLESIGY